MFQGGGRGVSPVRHLVLSGNPVARVSDLRHLLSALPSLTSLDLSSLSLVSLPRDLFRHNPRLAQLNLSSNYLVTIDPAVLQPLARLDRLDISHNFFMGLGRQFLAVLSARPGLTVVRMHDNPWVCDDCHVSHLVDWLHDRFGQ